MKKKVGCLGYLVVFIVWALVMALPFVTFKLAIDGQFTIGNTRIFLVQEAGSAGVGMQSSRQAREPAGCQQTTSRFMLWEGESSTAVGCYCNDGVARVASGRSCIMEK